MEYRTGGAPPAPAPGSKKQKLSHVCSICNAFFDDRQLLQDHFRNHASGSTSPKRKFIKKSKIQCDVCEAKFDTASKAVHHKFKMHRYNNEKYYCSWCGKQFTIKQMHETHVKSDHFSEAKKIESKSPETFSCDRCVAVFYKKDVYESHITQYHHYTFQYFLNNVSVLPPSKKIIINCVGDVQSAYYCHLCGYEYVLKYNLQSHLTKYHKNYDTTQLPTEIIKCSTCDASFYNKKAYEVHNSFHQPGDMYVTSEEMRLNVVTRVDQDFDMRRVRVFGNPTPKAKRANQHTVRHKILVKDEDLSSFSPPPSDSSDSETEFSMKNKVKTYSKKKTISLDDFVDMNKSIFGNKPDFPQESFKAIDEKRTLMIPENITSMRNECVKSSILEIKVEQTDDTQNLSENITSMHNEFVESPILEIKVEQIDDTQNLSEEVDPLADNKLSLSPKQILPKTNLKDNKILPNKRFVKVVTKEELEKLKIKGLVKVSKNQALNIKKNSTKPEEKSMKVNILVQKAPIMNKSDFTHSKTNEDKKLPSNKIISKKNPYVKLTRIDAQIFKKELQVSKIHADKIISKSPLKVI